jgi:protoporphyrinogen oxidase
LPTDLVIKIIEDFVSAIGNDPSLTRNYEAWLHAAYGKSFADTFPMVYGRKYHTTTMDRLTIDWIGPRMYRPRLEDVLRGAIGGHVAGAHYVENFRYPSTGGFVSYLEPFAGRFDVRLDHCVVALDSTAKVLRFSNGKEVQYEQVVSSIPLPDLIPLIHGSR